MKQTSANMLYETPEVSVLTLVSEGCIASSIGKMLDDMDKNEVYDEIF